jgi:hypothetical protein
MATRKNYRLTTEERSRRSFSETTVTIETEGQGRLKIEKSAIAAEFNPEQMQQK